MQCHSFLPNLSYEFALQPTFWVPPSCVQKLFLLLRDSEQVPYILPLSSKDSVVVGLGREEAAFLKIHFQQHRQRHSLLPLEWGFSDMIYRVKVLSSLGDKKEDCFNVETGGNTSYGKRSEHLVPLLKWTNHCEHRIKCLPKHLKTQRKTSKC